MSQRVNHTGIRKYFKLNENKSTTPQISLQAILRGKYIVLKAILDKKLFKSV